MNPHPERRRRTRKAVAGIWAASPPNLGLAVVDLSAGGAAVESTEGLRVGAMYPLRIFARGKTVSTAGVVRWCRLGRVEKVAEGETLALYRAGIAFRTEARPPGAGQREGGATKGFRPFIRGKGGPNGRNGPASDILRKTNRQATTPVASSRPAPPAPSSEAEKRQRELDALFD